MNAVTPFNFEGTNFRVIEIDAEPWFIAKEVAGFLGYADPDQAIRMHCKAAQTCPVKTTDQVRHLKIIPERDLYRLVMRSKLPGAERFEEWVVGEVLPAIRRTGRYEPAPARPAPKAEVPPDTGNPLLASILPAVLPLLDQCITDRQSGKEPEQDSNGMTEAERNLIALVRNAPWAAHCEAVAHALEEKAMELRGVWLPFQRAKDCYRAAILFLPDLPEHVRRTAVVMVELASADRFRHSGELVTRIETKQLATAMAVDRTTLQHRQKIMREVGMVEVEEAGGGRGRPCVYRFSRRWLESAAAAIQATDGFNHDALPAGFHAFAGEGRKAMIETPHSDRLAVADALDELAMQTRRSA